MTREQIAEAHHRASEWDAAHPPEPLSVEPPPELHPLPASTNGLRAWQATGSLRTEVWSGREYGSGACALLAPGRSRRAAMAAAVSSGPHDGVAICSACDHHSPNSFHHRLPIPNQIVMFTTLMRAPSFHHVPISTFPDPNRMGAGAVP